MSDVPVPVLMTPDDARNLVAKLGRRFVGGPGILIREARDSVEISSPLATAIKRGGTETSIRLVRVIKDGGAAGTATTPATWTYSVYAYSESDTAPDPLPTPLATGRAPRLRPTVGDVGAWVKAPDWSIAIAELRGGQSGNERWRLLVVDERLPVVVCDPGGG